jgi:hypothetical protein
MAKREAPEPSYDDDGNINNNSSSSSSSSSDEDATALMSPPHKKSKTESLVGPGGAACASTNNDNVVQRSSRSSDPTSSSVQQRSDERQENRDTAAVVAAAAKGRTPTDSISTLQSAQGANEDNAQGLVRDRNDNNNNAFLESTRKEKIHKKTAVLSKDNYNNDNAATTTKPQSLTCTVPSSSLMMNGSSTKASSIVGQGSIGKTVLYLSLFVLNITTLIIALIVINDISSSASYDRLYNQYMGQVQQIESSIFQSRQEEMVLLSSVHKLEQDMQLILQRNVVAMEEIDFIEPIIDDGDNTTTIQSQEDKDGWLEEMRILDVERNRVLNIWSTTLDEIKKYDLLLNPYDDDTFTTPDVVINDETPPLMDAHTAGKLGDMSALIDIATTDIKLLIVYDNNGWTPLHEAARNGHTEAVQFLINHGGLDKVRM